MDAANKDLVLGYDLGTSSVKAALFDAGGRVVARSRAAYPLLLPSPGHAEQRPADWWAAICKAARELLAQEAGAAERIAAIGIAGQMCAVVPVDKDGAALSNALIWLDTRSAAMAQHLVRGWPHIGNYGLVRSVPFLWLTGGAPNLSGKDPISKILWLRMHAPKLWNRTHKLLDAKDYIVSRLTGAFTTSFDCAHLTWLFDARASKKEWSAYLLGRYGLDSALFPHVLPASGIAGQLTPHAAEEMGLQAGVPVSAGLGDISAAALAAGGPHLSIGTSTWLAAPVPCRKADPLTGIGAICVADGEGYLLIAAQENGGHSLEWAVHTLGFDTRERFEAAARSTKGDTGAPFFFPWLFGERVPADDKFLRGGFANLSAEHGPGEMARAVYEGVALNVRWAASPFDRLTREPGRTLRLVGGGALSGFWCQMMADVLGRHLEAMETPDYGGARGAAMTAAVAAGWFSSLGAAVPMVRSAQTYQPDPVKHSYFSERFVHFAEAQQRLRPWYRGLNSAMSGGDPQRLE